MDGIANIKENFRDKKKNKAQKRKLLQEALLSAYPNQIDLEQMVYHEIDENIHEITADVNLKAKTFEIIKWAISRNRLKELIVGAKKENPSNPLLKNIDENDY